METDTTTIQVSSEVWKELNIRKKKGDTFEDVLRKLLKLNKKEVAQWKQQLKKKVTKNE